MRAYIPATFEEICESALNVQVAVGVTPYFCEQFGEESDIEFLEDCAFTQASFLSFMNLRNNSSDTKARFVVSVDIDSDEYVEDKEVAGKITLKNPVSWENIVCIHAEDIEEIPFITTLLENEIDEAVEQIDVVPLLWFDKSERELLVKLYKKFSE